jgi:anaerobic glycerol-3-phosphate dehydrogenase
MPAPDPNYGYTSSAGISGPANIGFAITPSNDFLQYRTRGVWVGTGGTLVYVDTVGNEVPLVNVPNGKELPIRADKVLPATTASDIIGWY